ncbi:Protein of Unknown Function (DUF239) [Quillaja saponaria]|uniref:Neprosin PEP catalytic domain-containing protein n=1 Tax=Quillaja saponaria TaxID=32244 RepID=A0AAD7LHP5_QUISA|nr:Protein of Unknown Function (DUF239) [Quillaja saponaria]
MGKIFAINLLAMVFLGLSCGGDIKAEGRSSYPIDIDTKLKLLNKPAVKSIQSEDGDIIDCVDIYKQPAFDHPALKNHIIQMRPSYDVATQENSKFPLSQIWQSKGSCPKGTIPIRRIQKKDLLRDTSLDNFGRKYPTQSSYPSSSMPKESNNSSLDLATVNHSTALLYSNGDDFLGAMGEINVWNPTVVDPEDFTTAQIWLKAGIQHSFESVESGWVVNPRLYGDIKTRFFVYWTRDGYRRTGCFDHTCSGFVQTNPGVALGTALRNVSTKSGQQQNISVEISKDPHTNNWWLKLEKNIPIGYWPPHLFRYLSSQKVQLVEWGGQVYSKRLTRPHTTTAMGSGEFASGLYGKACFIQNIRIVDDSYQVKYPGNAVPYSDETNCYSTWNHPEKGGEPVFYFGGPGRNPKCP